METKRIVITVTEKEIVITHGRRIYSCFKLCKVCGDIEPLSELLNFLGFEKCGKCFIKENFEGGLVLKCALEVLGFKKFRKARYLPDEKIETYVYEGSVEKLVSKVRKMVEIAKRSSIGLLRAVLELGASQG